MSYREQKLLGRSLKQEEVRELQQEQLEISLLSEPSLAEDWLTPEEDEAWQHL